MQGGRIYASPMCGRYAMDKNVDDLVRAYVADGGKAKDFISHWQASFSIAPTDPVPIVRERLDDGTIERELEMAAWDLRPAWRTKEKSPAPQFNARLETVAEKPLFRNAFTARRAIVPMTGYFEWTGPKGDKQPHYIHAGGELLSAAGLYEVRKVDEQWQISTLIITRTGVDSAGEVHDRMPVFLTPDVWDEWLTPDKINDPGPVLSMLDHSSQAIASGLSTYTVDRRVNSVAKIDPHDASLIEPVEA